MQLFVCVNETTEGLDEMDDDNQVMDDALLDGTLPSSKEGDTFLRNRPLQDDVDAGYFDILLQPSKRSDKNKQLKHEQFDFTVYVRNQCGFLTNRPLFWMQQFEKYVSSTTDVNSVTHYKWIKNDENKYQTSVIDIAYQTTRKVTIVINFLTGVVMVKGENFKNWIETEAVNVHPSLVSTNDEVPTQDPDDTADEVTKQIQSLFHSNSANKTSIESIDSSQRELREKINQQLSTYGDDLKILQNQIENSDAKMTIFMGATEKTCTQMLKDELTKVNKRIDKVFDKFIELGRCERTH